MKTKIKLPKVGDKIYVPSALHVYRGADDFAGGIATVKKVEISDSLPKNHCNSVMVGVEENPGTMYNWKHLAENQSKWKHDYGKQVAHPDPDLRPEFNDSEADWK